MSRFLRCCLASLGCVAFLIVALQGVPARAADTRGSTTSGGRADTRGSTTDVRCDFNGDGFGDLAVGVPGETVRSAGGAGAVIVSYSIGGKLLHTVLTAAMVTTPTAGDRFGSALSCGDFNGDGFADLAVAATGWSDQAGEVFVFYGDTGGLGTNPLVVNQRIRQETVGEKSEKNDGFGVALASGDLNGDGVDDLAIGSPGEDWEVESTFFDVGLVYALPGSPVGLLTPGHIVKACCGAGFREPARYGQALAIGDVDGDGRGELAIGAPNADVDEGDGSVIHEGGQVQLLPGSATDLVTTDGSWYRWEGAFAGWSSRPGDAFGSALAFGDFNGDHLADLAIRSWTRVDGVDGAGAVFVSSSNGVSTDLAGPVITQGWGDLPGVPARADHFGHSLATGDLDGDGRDELAIGIPNAEGWSGVRAVGATAVVYGGGSGLDDDHVAQFGAPQVEGGLAGFAVAVADLGGDGIGDLVVGIPGQTVSSVAHAGEVQIHPGVAGVGVTDDAPIIVTEGIHAGWSETGDPGTGSSWYEWGWTNDLVTGERLGTAIGG